MDNVTIGKWTGSMEIAAGLMDDEIREALHSKGFDTEQDFADAYCTAHFVKFGEDFVVN